jgi:hypothetical protein
MNVFKIECWIPIPPHLSSDSKYFVRNKMGNVIKFHRIEMICSTNILYFSFMISNKTWFIYNEK